MVSTDEESFVEFDDPPISGAPLKEAESHLVNPFDTAVEIEAINQAGTYIYIYIVLDIYVYRFAKIDIKRIQTFSHNITKTRSCSLLQALIW